MKDYYNATAKFHKKFEMEGTNNEDMTFRLNLLIEELGELAQAITKGKPRQKVIEENIDLLNLVLGNFISMRVSVEEIDEAFWKKHKKIMNREKRLVGGEKFRVSSDHLDIRILYCHHQCCDAFACCKGIRFFYNRKLLCRPLGHLHYQPGELFYFAIHQ